MADIVMVYIVMDNDLLCCRLKLGLRANMCIHECADMYKDMRADMCADMCVEMCADMHCMHVWIVCRCRRTQKQACMSIIP